MSLLRTLFSKDSSKAATPAPARPGLPVVRGDHHPLSPVICAWLDAQVAAVEGVQPANLAQLQAQARRSIQMGGDAAALSRVLRDAGGLPAKVASLAAQDLILRTRPRVERERQLALEIERATWLHSGAPCMVDPKHPTDDDRRQDAAHRQANGAVYSLAQGLVIDGRPTWPGFDRGCRCIARVQLPTLLTPSEN